MAAVTRNARKAEEMDRGLSYYLTGPMTGVPANNIPAFDDAAMFLRDKLQLTIVSPAELDDPEIRRLSLLDLPVPQTWGDFLARDVKLIADTDISGMIMMPGWERSRGARLEAYVGILKRSTLIDFVFYLYPSLERVSVSYILARL